MQTSQTWIAFAVVQFQAEVRASKSRGCGAGAGGPRLPETPASPALGIRRQQHLPRHAPGCLQTRHSLPPGSPAQGTAAARLIMVLVTDSMEVLLESNKCTSKVQL